MTTGDSDRFHSLSYSGFQFGFLRPSKYSSDKNIFPYGQAVLLLVSFFFDVKTDFLLFLNGSEFDHCETISSGIFEPESEARICGEKTGENSSGNRSRKSRHQKIFSVLIFSSS